MVFLIGEARLIQSGVLQGGRCTLDSLLNLGRDLDDLRARLKDRELALDVSEAALDRLCAVGFDPVFGARPLKRAIQQQLENPLAQELLAGKFEPGSTISVTPGDEQLSFSVK